MRTHEFLPFFAHKFQLPFFPFDPLGVFAASAFDLFGSATMQDEEKTHGKGSWNMRENILEK